MIKDLAILKCEADQAVERYRDQLQACIEEGLRTAEIARAIGLTPQAVSMRRRRLKDGGT